MTSIVLQSLFFAAVLARVLT